MAGFLIVVALSLGKLPLLNTIHSKALLFIILSGVAGAMSWLFYFIALKHGPVTGVAALDRLSVVFVLVFALLFLGQKFTWASAIGAALITVGAILMTLK
jgi:transporter family protein